MTKILYVNFKVLFLSLSWLLLLSCAAKNIGTNGISSSDDKNMAADANTQSVKIIIKAANETREFARAELLKSPLLQKITVVNDPSYKGITREYKAIPFASLFKGLKIDNTGTLLFTCHDGFSAPISLQRVLNQDPQKSIAFLAVEDPEHPWPDLKENSGLSAGPFYLIWQNPEKSKIATEEWPFQLAEFEFKESIEKLYPKIVPHPVGKNSERVIKGYKLFTQNCFVCHTLNEQGNSKLGPDLNHPFSPTEYFKAGFLKKIIRNPQDVRHWPQGVMKGFDVSVLSDSDVENIILYLKQMSHEK